MAQQLSAAKAAPLATATARGLRIPVAALAARLGGAANLRRLLNALTVTEAPAPGRPKFMARKTAAAYQFARGAGEAALLLPRLKGPALLRAGALRGVAAGADLPPPARKLPAAACAPGAPLYAYQQAAVAFLCEGPLSEAAADAFAAAAYLQVDTGLGKTRIAGGVIAAKRVPAAVVVPTDAIREQWLDELADAFPGLRVGAFRNPPKGSRKAPPSAATHDVVVFIVNTFRAKEPADLGGFGLVLFDEAHEYHSPVNRQALWLASGARYVLGLSATPEQDSARGLDRYVFFHLGAPTPQGAIPGFDVSGAQFSGRVRKIEYFGAPEHCGTAATAAGTASAILTIGNIVQDPARLRLVVAEIGRLLHAHERPDAAAHGLGPHPETGRIRRHGVFCFSEHRATVVTVRDALVASFGAAEVYAPELDENGGAAAEGGAAAGGGGGASSAVSVLRGGVARNAVQSARRIGAHVVLTTYGYSRRGISLPDMTALVKLTPRRNGGIQILGRILRRGSDQSIEREVVDIVDMRTGLKSQWADRAKGYKAKGYPVATVRVDWSQYAEKGGGGGGGGRGGAGGGGLDEGGGGGTDEEEEEAEPELDLADLLGAGGGSDEEEAGASAGPDLSGLLGAA